MIFRPQISLIEFDLVGYLDDVDDKMVEHTKEAAKRYLTAVLRIIPTWSRASRATFNALAEAVGFNLTYGPILSRKDRLELGLSTGRGGIETDNFSYWKFFYETDLRYLAYNEYNQVIFGKAPNVFSRTGLTHPTPYHFQDAGQLAFEDYAQGVQLPSPLPFIYGRRIS